MGDMQHMKKPQLNEIDTLRLMVARLQLENAQLRGYAAKLEHDRLEEQLRAKYPVEEEPKADAA